MGGKVHAGDMGKGKQVSKVWLFLHGSSTGETSIPRGLSHGQRRKESCGPGRKPRGEGLMGGPHEKREENPAGGPCSRARQEGDAALGAWGLLLHAKREENSRPKGRGVHAS